MAAAKKNGSESGAIIVRGLREDFAKFFEDPSRDSFRDMIRNHGGELRELDFKAAWPATPVLAKHVSSPSRIPAGVASSWGRPKTNKV